MTKIRRVYERRINPGLSIWLDVLRVLAAFVVLVGHLAHTKFTNGDLQFLRDAALGPDAVIVFFVISGLVIAYAADRDANVRDFAFNRATRIFSVMVPAILITVAADGLGRSIDPESYPPEFYAEIGLMEALLRGLSFTNEWAGFLERVRIGTNGALWSLSYEVTFYVAFGVAVFTKGALRFVLLTLIILAAGLPIFALFPAWFAGVLVWRSLSREASRPDVSNPLMMAILPLLAAVCMKVAGVPELLHVLTMFAFQPVNANVLLVYSYQVAWHTLLAGLIAIHLRYVALYLQNVKINEAQWLIRAVRWLAGASFSIYVVHYPVLHLLDVLLPNGMPGHHIVMLSLTLLACLAFAHVFERPLPMYRRIVRATLDKIRSVTLVRSPLVIRLFHK